MLDVLFAYFECLSAIVRAMFQAAIVILVAFALDLTTGTNFAWYSLLGVFGIVFLISVGLSSLFTTLTLRSTRMKTPQAILQLVTLPLMFASSAYFPINQMPSDCRRFQTGTRYPTQSMQ